MAGAASAAAVGLALIPAATASAQAAPSAQPSPGIVRTAAAPPDVPPYAALQPYWASRPVIEAIGRADLRFQPNRVALRVEMFAVNANSNVALNEVSAAAQAAVARAREIAGDKAKISATSSVEINYEQYRERDGTRIENERLDKVESYTHTWTVSVELSDIALLPRVRAALLAGENAQQVGAAQFRLEPDAAQARAVWQAAVEDGRERARIAATAHGGTLRLLVLQEGRNECLSSPTTDAAPRMAFQDRTTNGAAFAEAGEVILRGARNARVAANYVMPAEPEPVSLTAQVCMVYALER